jgi:hypothetical protein
MKGVKREWDEECLGSANVDRKITRLVFRNGLRRVTYRIVASDRTEEEREEI